MSHSISGPSDHDPSGCYLSLVHSIYHAQVNRLTGEQARGACGVEQRMKESSSLSVRVCEFVIIRILK
jgi:hypothetical protein